MKQTIYTLLLLGGLLFNSCSLDIKLEDQFSDPDAITNAKTSREFLSYCYSLIPETEYELSVLSSDFMPGVLVDKDIAIKDFYNWKDASISEFSQTLWETNYNIVANINVLLERVALINPKDEIEREELGVIVSEALCLKAMTYFDLLRLFATDYSEGKDMPGIILKDNLDLEFLPRSSMDDSVNEIRNLLTKALTTANPVSTQGIISSSSIYYLLAELELFAQNYTKAIEYANKLIEAYPEAILTNENYERLWSKEDSKERIFGKYLDGSFYSNIQYDDEDGDYFIINNNISYSDNDIRSSHSIFHYPNDKPNSEYRFLGKYNAMNKASKQIKYINKQRVAGAYFIIAESLLKNNDIQATDVINKYLTKRGAETIDPSLGSEALLEKIMEEKQKEFVGEGSFYFDMKRNRKKDLKRYNILGRSVSTTIKKDDYRWTFPIPSSEYKYNDKVVQNKGWKIEVAN